MRNEEGLYNQCFYRIKNACNELKHMESLLNTTKSDKYILKHAIIFSCGNIEQMLKRIIINRLSLDSNKDACFYFSESLFPNGLNPNQSNILSTIKKINEDVYNDLKKEFEVKRKYIESLNSLVTLRNKISHGGDIDRGIKDIRQYFFSGIVVIHTMIRIFEVRKL